MRLMRFHRLSEPASRARLGVLLPGEMIGDIRAGYASYLAKQCGDNRAQEVAAVRIPRHLTELLQDGHLGWQAVLYATEWLKSRLEGDRDPKAEDDATFFSPLAECWLHAPVRPGKLVMVEANYRSARAYHHPQAIENSCFSAWIKATSAIIGPMRNIGKKPELQELDCAVNLAAVIGRACKDVSAGDAPDVVAGYVVVGDVFVKERPKERQSRNGRFLERMLDGFAPMGPWLVTPDEIADPSSLDMTACVNGEVCQTGNTRDMLRSVPHLITHLSKMTLEPGDVIATGAVPSQEASHLSRPLVAGDTLESEIAGIGKLRNKIVNEP